MRKIILLTSLILLLNGCSKRTDYLIQAQNTIYTANRAIYFEKIKQLDGIKDVHGDRETEKTVMAKGYGSFLSVKSY